jgi:class 3 adenylate cyclase
MKVNRAARVVEQATGGQVLMSAGTHFHLSKEALTIFKAQQLMENISIVDLGPRYSDYCFCSFV